jgi:SAP domain-containing ribonucleoprotein
MDEASLRKLKVVELRDLLSKASLPTDGLKVDLVARLAEANRSPVAAEEEAPSAPAPEPSEPAPSAPDAPVPQPPPEESAPPPPPAVNSKATRPATDDGDASQGAAKRARIDETPAEEEPAAVIETNGAEEESEEEPVEAYEAYEESTAPVASDLYLDTVSTSLIYS